MQRCGEKIMEFRKEDEKICRIKRNNETFYEMECDKFKFLYLKDKGKKRIKYF